MISVIPNRKKRKNSRRKSSVEEFKSSQRQRNINLPTAKSTYAPRTSYHGISNGQNFEPTNFQRKIQNKYQITKSKRWKKKYKYISQTQNEVLNNNPGSTEDNDTVLPMLKELYF